MAIKNKIIDLHTATESPVDGDCSKLAPLVVPAAGAAKLCSVSRAAWWKWFSAGKTPAPVRLGSRKPVWIVTELEEWLRAGAPPRDVWERIKNGGRR